MENAATPLQNQNKSVQEKPSLLQDLSKIPTNAYAVLIVVAFVAFGAIPIPIGLALLVIGYVIWNKWENEKAMREAKARAATYANIHGPVIVPSIHPNETVIEVEARCQEWREQIELSGNPYASKIPIIAFPYDPVLMDTGEFGGGWTVYEKRVSEKRHIENVRWHEGRCPAELKQWFASNVLPAPKAEFQNQN